MTRPLFPVLFCFAGGILLEHYANIINPIAGCRFRGTFSVILLFGYGLLLGIWYILYRFNGLSFSTGCLLVLTVAIGMIRYAASAHLPVQHISHFVEDERVSIEGFLYKPPEIRESLLQNRVISRSRYLYVKTTWLEQGAFRYRVCGKVRITLPASTSSAIAAKTFSYGDTIRTRLHLRPPESSAEFDYREYLRRQGIYHVSSLRSDRYIIKLPLRRGNRLLAWIYSLRRRIITALDTYSANQKEIGENYTADAIQVIKAMTLGTSREISPAIKETFRNAGMYHFLVVSGIHIGILVGTLHLGLHFCYIPLRYRSIFLTVILVFYAGLTGFHFPVLRAVIMAVTLYFSITWTRISDPFYSLAFSASLILFLFPAALFEVSFQLTIAATASILLLFRVLKDSTFWKRVSHSPYIIQFPAVALIITFGAMIGIAPLLILYFQQVSPYTFFSNLIVFPLVSLLLPLGLLANFLSLLVPWNLMFPLFSLNVALARGVLALAALFPEYEIVLPRLSPVIIGLYYILMSGMYLYRKHLKFA